MRNFQKLASIILFEIEETTVFLFTDKIVALLIYWSCVQLLEERLLDQRVTAAGGQSTSAGPNHTSRPPEEMAQVLVKSCYIIM